MDRLYEFSVRGREVPLREPHESDTQAARRAQQLADERGRTVSVYRDSASIYARPIFRAFPARPTPN